MTTCRICKEEINIHKIATKAGQVEAGISGICEVCFDNTTVDMEEGLVKLDKEVLQMVSNIKPLVLAGGSLRSTFSSDVIQDYDLFMLDLDDKQSVKDNIVKSWENSEEGRIIFKCPQGKLYSFERNDGVKIQLIDKQPYNSVEELIETFDITASCAAYDGERFYKNKRFLFDTLNKRININTVQYPVATMKRIAKYQNKGYSLSSEAAESFVKIVSEKQWSEEDLELYID